MAKGRSVEEAIARLHALRGQTALKEVQDELRRALAGKVNLVIAKAASLVGEARLRELAGELEAAFERMMAAGADKGCAAKTAIAKALFELESGSSEATFLTGVHHVQMEPAFGAPVDAAAELRGVCALGLVRLGYRDVLVELTDLLMDAEMQARIAAARGLGAIVRDDAALLLRLKLLAGDREPDVMAEAMAALARVWPERSIPFLARFLDDRDAAVRQGAALALGSTRRPAAVEVLRQRWESEFDGELKRSILVALATARMPEALDVLLSVVEQGEARDAAHALNALHPYRHDAAVKARAAAAVATRADPRLQTAFAQAFNE